MFSDFWIPFQGLPRSTLFCRRSYQQVLRPFFEEELLCGQNLLETEEKFEKILEMIPDECMALNYLLATVVGLLQVIFFQMFLGYKY